MRDSSYSNLFFGDYPSKPSYHEFHTLPPHPDGLAASNTQPFTLLPISLRDPEISLRGWPTAADRIGNALGHGSHGEAPVETEAVATEVAPGVLVEIEGVERATEAGLEVAEQGIDPAELG